MAILLEEERIWVTDLEDPELRLICQFIDPHQKVKKRKTDQKVINSFVRECPSLLPSYSSELMVSLLICVR